MIRYGTWKGEPASEEAWEVDWSIAEPDPEFLPGRDYFDILSQKENTLPNTKTILYFINGR